MSLRAYHLPESEYPGDVRLEKLVETVRAVRAKARTAGRSLNEKLTIYNALQANAYGAPSRDRDPCFSL
jgi:hypothetical protein